MKTSMEDLLYNARVDVVFTGHVHAYERFVSIFFLVSSGLESILLTFLL
jgi:hypothetical protein